MCGDRQFFEARVHGLSMDFSMDEGLLILCSLVNKVWTVPRIVRYVYECDGNVHQMEEKG